MGLTERPVRRIVRAVADAAKRWSDADFPARVGRVDAIVERTGYSLPMVEHALDRLFASLDAPGIEGTIERELGSLDVLDRYVDGPQRVRSRAFPIGRIVLISSRTTIGVAIVPAIFALCAKCDVLVKDREDGLVEAFFATLGDELDELRDAASAQTWNGAERDLANFDAVVAFGDDATLAEIRGNVAPTARFLGYGSKASAGYVAREALSSDLAAERIAAGAARDLLLYESQGCLSLHVLFVERGGAIAPAQFAARLAAAVESAASEFPARERSAEVAMRVASARDLGAFRAANGGGSIRSDARASYLLVLDPPRDEPPGFLPRALAIHAVDAPAEAAAYLHRHRLPLEGLAIAGGRPDVLDFATRAGCARIASFGGLQNPPIGAYHGGRPRIAEFVRWITDET